MLKIQIYSTYDIHNQVEGLQDFEWLKNARYYWDSDADTLVVRMSNSKYFYAYEYLGASARLVITPLTVSENYIRTCV